MRALFVIPVIASILILGTLGLFQDAESQTLVTARTINGFGIGCNTVIGSIQVFQDIDLTIRVNAIITNSACIPDGSIFTAVVRPDDTGTDTVSGATAEVSGLVPLFTTFRHDVAFSFSPQGFGGVTAGFTLSDLPDIDNDVDDDGFDSVASGGTDCDDGDNTIFPGAAETPYDGVDSDCDGLDPDDVDVDGFPSTLVIGGTDCDDGDNTIFPGAAEIGGDGIDQDCDGFSDEGLSDELFLQIANLQSDLAAALTDLAQAEADRDQALDDLADALTDIVTLQGDLAQALQDLGDALTDLADALATITAQDTTIAGLEADLAAAITQRDQALADLATEEARSAQLVSLYVDLTGLTEEKCQKFQNNADKKTAQGKLIAPDIQEQLDICAELYPDSFP